MPSMMAAESELKASVEKIMKSPSMRVAETEKVETAATAATAVQFAALD